MQGRRRNPERASGAARRILCASLVLGGCVAGEPGLDATFGESDADFGAQATPALAVEQLNEMNTASLTRTRWEFSLAEPCTLRIEGRRPDGATDVRLVDLLAIDVQVKGNLGDSLQAVQIDRSGHPALDREHLFEAGRWTEAVEYASHVKTLQRACAGTD